MFLLGPDRSFVWPDIQVQFMAAVRYGIVKLLHSNACCNSFEALFWSLRILCTRTIAEISARVAMRETSLWDTWTQLEYIKKLRDLSA
jgi:hypothetical protein